MRISLKPACEICATSSAITLAVTAITGVEASWGFDFNFKVKSSAMKMLVLKENVDVNFKYLYYCMKNDKKSIWLFLHPLI